MPGPVEEAQATKDIYAGAVGTAVADAIASGGTGGGVDTVANEGAFTATGADATGATANRLLAANASRKRLMVVNDSNQDCYLRYGALAVTTSAYTVKLPAGGTSLVDDKWLGEVRGIMGAAITVGAVRYSEQTA